MLKKSGVELEIISPKSVFRASVEAKVVNEDCGMALIKMSDARNQTSHIYNEAMSQSIAHKIPGFYELMNRVLKRIDELEGGS